MNPTPMYIGPLCIGTLIGEVSEDRASTATGDSLSPGSVTSRDGERPAPFVLSQFSMIGSDRFFIVWLAFPCQPGIQFFLVGEDTLPLASGNAANWEALFFFPANDRADIPAKIGRNVLPRVESLTSRQSSSHLVHNLQAQVVDFYDTFPGNWSLLLKTIYNMLGQIQIRVSFLFNRNSILGSSREGL